MCLHHRCCPRDLYVNLLENLEVPTLILENKILYGEFADSDPPPGFDVLYSDERFPAAYLKATVPPSLTIVSIGGTSLDAEKAVLKLFDEEEIIADLILPTCLYPFNIEVLRESLSRTRRLLVVEEGQGFVSMSSEILAQVVEYFDFSVRCRRITAAPNPIPASRLLEEQSLPNLDSISRAAMEVVDGGG